VSAVESAAMTKAGRNAIVTSMIVCCGFVACWSIGQIRYFLRFIGYTIPPNTWFHHFTSVVSTQFLVFAMSQIHCNLNSVTIFVRYSARRFQMLLLILPNDSFASV